MPGRIDGLAERLVKGGGGWYWKLDKGLGGVAGRLGRVEEIGGGGAQEGSGTGGDGAMIRG